MSLHFVILFNGNNGHVIVTEEVYILHYSHNHVIFFCLYIASNLLMNIEIGRIIYLGL